MGLKIRKNCTVLYVDHKCNLSTKYYLLAHNFIVCGIGDGLDFPERHTLLVLTVYFEANSLNGFQLIGSQTVNALLTDRFWGA